MEEIKLDVQVRSETGSRRIKKIRREDFVPAVVYGGKKQPTIVKVDRRAYERIMRHHHGQNVLFHLTVLEEGKKLRDYSAIVKEEQHDPVSDRLLHIDFNRISLSEKIEVKVQVEAKGEPVGVKRDGGSLEHALWELEVTCLPTQIPEKIVVEVGHLEIGDAIHVKEIVLPEGVTTKTDPDAIVLSVVPPMKEEPETPAEEELTEPEVTKEKKKEEAPEEGKEKAEEKKEAPKAKEQKPEAKGKEG